MVQDFSQYALQDIGADYTIELGTLIAMGYDTDEKLHLSPDYYPIFNEQHRAELNEKIIRHYLMREISVETPQAFAFLLGRTMNENMPYYNQLYETELMKFDPKYGRQGTLQTRAIVTAIRPRNRPPIATVIARAIRQPTTRQ